MDTRTSKKLKCIGVLLPMWLVAKKGDSWDSTPRPWLNHAGYRPSKIIHFGI